MSGMASLVDEPYGAAADQEPRMAAEEFFGRRLLLCAPDGLNPDQAAFAQAIADRLHGRMDMLPAMTSYRALAELATGYDLLLLGEKRPSWWQLLLGEPAGGAALRHVPTSLLLMRRARWPLRHILFVCRAEASDEWALPWVQALGAAETAVTLLVVVPCVPALYRLPGPYPIGLKTLLDPHTTSGRRVRSLLQALADVGVQARIRLRDGEPDEQIRREAGSNLYDLIIMAGEGHGRLPRALLGELVSPMLSWLATPLLLARERQFQP